MLRQLLPVLVLACAGASACANDFTPYNEIDRFRVLALAADAPWLAPTQSTAVRALVVPKEGETVRYNWSWCPFTMGSQTGYSCAIEHDELQANIDMVLGANTLLVPAYELGTSTTAVFAYSLPPQFFAAACQAIRMGDVPEFVELPPCDGTFPITVRLEAKSGDATINAVKELVLVYEERPLNHNPVLDGVKVTSAEGRMGELLEDVPYELSRNMEHTFELVLSDAMAEPYLYTPIDGSPAKEIKETLAVTWFIEGGELDSTRTGFIDGEVPLERTRENKWTPPKAVDYPKDTARIFIVIRDDRKGASWISRIVRLGS